jgi:hypothetical protein
MICIYCLRREAVSRRRCETCNDYLSSLTRSNDQADRTYGVTLIDMAVYRLNRREGSQARRIVVRAA